MDVKGLLMEKFRNAMRMLSAILLLTVPFLSMPLAFCRLTGNAVPLYGLVRWADFPVMGLVALAVILFFPERLKTFFQCRKYRFLLAAAGLFTFTVLLQTFWYGNYPPSLIFGNLFWITVPLAAVALAPELRRIIPFFAVIAAAVLLISGFTSEKFTGLTGNWNWTQGLIAALLPGIVVIIPDKIKLSPQMFLTASSRQRYIQAGILLTVFLACMGIFYPDELSRAVMAGVAGGICWFFIRRRTPEKTFRRGLIVLLAGGMVIFAVILLCLTLPDTRFNIWQGALNIFLDRPLTGAGIGQFSEKIRQFLSREYFFSPFPSVHIDHAHNDLLHLAAENGIPGIVFYIAGAVMVFSRRQKSMAGKLFQWIFAVLLICGWFDQHNFTLAGGSLLAVSAGVLLAVPEKRAAVFEFRWPLLFPAFAGILLLFAAVNVGIINWQNSNWIRQGDLLLMRGDLAGSAGEYIRSLRQEKSVHALYQLAEISLIRGQSQKTLYYLKNLQDHCGKSNYRHFQRLKAVASLQTGNPAAAASAMAVELKNAPYSVINARFQRLILRAVKADPALIAAADRHFFELCRMRKIQPQALETLPLEVDDGAFPAEFQSRMPEKILLASTVGREILASLLMLLAVYGIGKLLLLRSGCQEIFTEIALGMVVCGMLSLIIPAGVLQYLIIVPALPGGYYGVIAVKKSWRWALLFMLLFLPLLASALLPPSAWDELVYQISLLKKYTFLSSTAVQMDNPYSAYPSLGQLWLLPGFASGGLNVPKILLLAVNCLLLTGFLHRSFRFGKVLTLAAWAAVLLSPLSWILMRSFYVESFIVLFGFAGVLQLTGECRRRNIFLAGVMAGAASAVKLTGIGVSLALLVLLLADRERRKLAGYFIAGGFLAAFPFFLRVWIGCGNPFYPYFSAWFGGTESVVMVEEFHRALGGNYGISSGLGAVWNWLACVINPQNYDGITPGFQFSILFLLSLVIVLADRGKNRWVSRGGAALLAAWLFWNFSAQQTRFLLPLLYGAAFMLVYGGGFWNLKLRQLAGIAVVMASLLTLYLNFAEFKHFFLAWKQLSEARKSPVHFAAWISDDPLYAEVCIQLDSLKGKKVAALWDRRGLYWPENVTLLMPGFQEKLTPVPATADALYEVLKEYDYLMIRPPLADVDKGIEFVPQAVELNSRLFELLGQGKVAVSHRTSDGQISILRIVPETAPIVVCESR